MISVDFCRGSGGAFLAINGVVVAGEVNGDGSGRVIQGFEIEESMLTVALRHPHVEKKTPSPSSSGEMG